MGTAGTGNITLKLERELTVSIPDAHLAAAIRSAVGRRTGLSPAPSVILIDLGGRILGTAGALHFLRQQE